MKVRHINAKRGEYIAVHRQGRAQRHSADGGLGAVILWVIALSLIYCYWEVILATLLLAGALYLGYTFRKGIAAVCVSGWNCVTSGCGYIFRKMKPRPTAQPAAGGASCSCSVVPSEHEAKPAYGKISQYR